ncbi:DUF1045 domain-containing protein [Magnetovibrio sp. PR-2]|uniref:DUF1045 domain-containing protein n=1 Tax=Magnetovibrio sp. PR-2 TaxID=3120356 RepID=UPI002FCDF6F3
MAKARYAIYYMPEPDSKLWRCASKLLGWDSFQGVDVKPPKLDGIKPERLREITASARHYGFHGTLKPPFYLSKTTDRAMLDEALEAFAAGQKPFKVPALELAELDGFIALRPKKACEDLDAFAKTCVKSFDNFRAPPSAEETQKRLKADLTKSQKKMLDKWGYPYVMDEFRFHMTLSERLKDKERKTVFDAIEPEIAKVLTDKSWTFNLIALVRQKSKDEPFTVVKTYPLKPHAKSRWPLRKKK